MKRMLLIGILLLVLFVVVLAFRVITQASAQQNKILCDTNEALKEYGHDWIGDDVFIKCDCSGEIIHKSKKGFIDRYWCECTGDITYSCYKLNIPRDKIPFNPVVEEKDYLAYIVSRSNKIPCPPNRWMGTYCENDQQCAAVGCRQGFKIKCQEGRCVCNRVLEKYE